MSEGRVILVGAGPGDPGLITVRGAEALGRADVVVYDYLAGERLLDGLIAELVYVGKKAGQHTMPQEEINQLLVDLANQGKTVVRLKGGDPYVFGRGGEEVLALEGAGIDFEVVPGITAGVAALAYAGIPATHRHLAANLGLITGHEDPTKDASDLDYEALARWCGTLVFYMGVKNLPTICRRLIDHGLAPGTPGALVRWGTTPKQEVVTAPIAELPARAEEAGIKPPAVIVIGQVVSLRDKLNWFERRPLFAQRIVVTRSRSQASGLVRRLAELGADAIEMPAIRIAEPEDPGPLQAAVAQVGTYDWLVLTSVNAVRAVFDELARQGRDARAVAGVRVCAIGPATAETLAQRGIVADVQPAKYVSSEITGTLAGVENLAGKRVLCPRADIAPPDMIEALTAAGAAVTEVTAYRTEPDGRGAERVRALLEADEVDWITFTSSSTVRNFLSVISAAQVTDSSVRLASIGPVTSQTLRDAGLTPAVEAEEHTIPGLVTAILNTQP